MATSPPTSTTPPRLDELLTPKQVAEYRGTTTAVLAQERHKGAGPRFIRDGRRIRYRATDIHAYLDARTETPGGAR
ncbi:MAG: DNA-binding protein [Mycobacterium sp.]|nr:DNA-binding protein [Mycobacterium sp.]